MIKVLKIVSGILFAVVILPMTAVGYFLYLGLEFWADYFERRGKK